MASKILKFTCPDCQQNTLDIVENSTKVSTSIVTITPDGDFEYGDPVVVDATVDHYSCPNCNFILKDKNNEIITNNIELAKWITTNCPQK